MNAMLASFQEIDEAGSNFIFVDSSNDGGNQTRIRRHVMRDIGKKRRSKDKVQVSNISRKRMPLQLKAGAVSSAPNSGQRGSNEDDGQEEGGGRSTLHSSPQIMHLGNARLDPFARYPIPMDRRSLELLWHMFDEHLPSNTMFYRYVWYPLAFSSAAAFHQILSMFPVYLKTTGLAHIVAVDDDLVLHHHIQALRLVRERLEDPGAAAIDDGILATVIGMICQSHLIGDAQQYMAHVNALGTLLELRGGGTSLGANPILGFAIRLVDMSTSYSQAKIPSLVTAPCLLEANNPTVSTPLYTILSKAALSWYVQYPTCTSLMENILQLWDMFSRLNAGAIRICYVPWGEDCIWRFMHPVLDRLLRFRCPKDMSEEHAAMHEACRISGLLSLAQLRRMLGITPVPTAYYVSEVRQHIVEGRMDWRGLEPMKIWCLVATVLEVCDQSLYNLLVNEAAATVVAARLDSVQQLQRNVESVTWADAEMRRRLHAFWADMTSQAVDQLSSKR